MTAGDDRECVVLGAGIIGLNVALRLAQAGARVTVVDSGFPSGGTSGTSGSLVGSNEKRPFEYYRLGVLSMAAMRRLAAELEHDSWFLPTGHLEWADSEPTQRALDERVERLRAWAYPVHRLSADQVVRDLEPDLVVPEGVRDVTFFSDDSLVHPHLLIALLLRRLEALGVRFCFGVGPATVSVGPAGAEGVRVGDGQTVGADVVLTCVGRWTQEVLTEMDVDVPMVSPWGSTPEALGFQVITTPVPVDIRRMVRMPGLSIRPAGGGRLMLHGRPEEVELHAEGEAGGLQWDGPLTPLPPQAASLAGKVTRVVRHTANIKAQSATASVRALTEDGLPVLGWVPGVAGLYTVVTHSGIGLGPLLGELVAQEVLSHPATDLDAFRPERFADEAWTHRERPMRAHAPRAPSN